MKHPSTIHALVLGFALARTAATEDVLRLGLLGNKFNKPYTSGVVGFAQERRTFEQALAKEGVRIEWVFFSSGAPAVNEAIANGKIDLAVYGDVGSVVGKAGGLPTKVIAPNGMGGGLNFVLVPTTSNLRTPADLKGHRIALARATAPQLLFFRWIRRAGLSEKDVRIVNLGSADQENAFVSGGVDILIGNSLDLVDRGLARVLATVDADSVPSLAGFGNVVATESVIKEHPRWIQAWVDAYVATSESVLDEKFRPEFVRLATKTGTGAKSARISLPRRIEWSFAPVFDPYYFSRLREAVADCAKYGISARSFDPSAWIDRSFLDAALESRDLARRWRGLRTLPEDGRLVEDIR